ncbi:unnamed protein product [Moneuplotes crassus]|uniref:Uncharacterized protein n=1 Tax=Euplotes crassus TaxID=5936 RepID=A0AAD1XDR6_EUPCR|nr:unnamed protein product [Moneuplotes crassus]
MGQFCTTERKIDIGESRLPMKKSKSVNKEKGKPFVIKFNKKDDNKIVKRVNSLIERENTWDQEKEPNPSRKTLNGLLGIHPNCRKAPFWGKEEDSDSISSDDSEENKGEDSSEQSDGYYSSGESVKSADSDRSSEMTRSNTPPSTKKIVEKTEEVENATISVGPTEVIYNGPVDIETGKMNGVGEMYLPNGAEYRGDIVQNICEGQGRLKLPSGGVYEGMFHDNKFHGKGKFLMREGGFYFGDWVKGHKHGQGKEIAPDGSKYDGQFRHGKYDGKGELKFGNGIIYVGEFRDGKLHGHGTISQPDGTEVTGIFKNDEMVSQISLKKNTDVS